MSTSIGVDIGGTKIAVAVVDPSGAIASPVLVQASPAEAGGQALIDAVADMIGRVEDGVPSGHPVGVGSAGVISPAGRVLSATDTIAEWQGLDLRSALETVLRRPVVVLNDAHAAAVGEAHHGAGVDVPSFLMVTVGTGLGGAVWADGHLQIGATGTAGSIGHMAARTRGARRCSCGQTGHLEAYVAGPALEEAYQQRTGIARSLRDMASAPDSDEVAWGVIDAGAEILGIGLGDALNVLDVEAVILGGGVSQIGPRYLSTVSDAMRRSALPGPSHVPLIPARLGTHATLIGAAVHAGAQGAG